MKDQYVGDVSDYLKYAALRAWAHEGLTIGLAWMRTEPDLRSDGGLTRYLASPDLHRRLDPELFDGLQDLVATGRRSVRALIEAKLLAHRFSYETLLDDSSEARAAWFSGLAQRAGQADVLFFDPDNGLEVASVRRGRSGSRRYVYLDELAGLWRPGQAVAVYQHFPRTARAPYLEAQLRRLGEAWPGTLSFAVCSPRIALLLSVPAALSDVMLDAVSALAARGTGAIGPQIVRPEAGVRG